ncbi:hypothetical protein Bbelb_377450 [Branchiostoma belcheri]|nr:hypothetical protein Bbelb_377450 [Branchiostoma belcheri]
MGVFAPTLFAIFFSMMLKEAKEDLTEGNYIRFRTDGSVFNLRRLLAHTKTPEELILDLLCALLAHTEEALQAVVNHFATACKAFGLTISLKKTKVMYQIPPRETYVHPRISIDERFHQRCLRCIMGINWQDYVTNIEVLGKANLHSIETMQTTRQIRWAGHLARMEDSRMPKAVFYGELCQRKREKQGSPRKRFKDQLKRQLTAADIPVRGRRR